MKITVTIGNVVHTGRLPFIGCDYVAVDADCPICAAKHAIRDRSGRVVALAGAEGMAAAKAAFPGAIVGELPDARSLRVRMPTFEQGHDRFTGSAECCRCRSIVGPMEMVVSTLFGLEEDDRVLNGRCRVY